MAYQSEIQFRVRVLDAELKELESRIKKVQNPFGPSGARRGPGSAAIKAAGVRAQKEEAALIAKSIEDLDRLRNSKAEKTKQTNLRRIRFIRDQRIKAARDVAAAERRIEAENFARSKSLRGKAGGAAGSALIGGAFPLLFGQGGAAAVGGGLGGLAGGLVGGQFGFALSLVGTALGDVVSKSEEFDKSLASLNSQAVKVGSSSLATARNVSELSKQLGVSKEETVELLGAFSAFEDFADKKVLAQIFGTDAGAFDRLAAAQTELKVAEAIFEARDKITNAEAKRLLDQLKVEGSTAVELALAESLAEAQARVTAEKAKQVTLGDRLTSFAAEYLLGTGGLDVEAAGQERARKILEDFEKGRETRRQRFIELLKEQRDLIRQVASFETSKPKKESREGSVDTGERLIRQLNREIALKKASTDEERKRLRIQFQTEDTQLSINKLRDADQKILLTALNLQRQRLAEEVLVTEELKKQQKAYMEMGLAQAGLSRIDEKQAGLIFGAGTLGATQETLPFGSAIEIGKIVEQELAVERLLEKYKEIGQASQLAAGLVTVGFAEMVSGAKSAEEVFASFLNNLADMLIKTAQQMIAQYIAIGIARMFAVGGDSSSIATGILSKSPTGAFGSLTPQAFPTFANGGNPPVNRPSIVGERGPELFVPRSSGTIIPNNALGGGANVTVNVDASGSNVQGDSNQASQLGKAIGAAVQAELVKQKRPGGLLAGV